MKRALVLALIVLLSAGVIAYFVVEYGLSLTVVATHVATVSGLVIGAGVIWAKVIMPIGVFVSHHATTVSHLLDNAKKVVEQHQNMDFAKLVEDVQFIIHDLKPNSGTSLRDVVDRIEIRLALVDRVNWALRQDGPVGIFRCDKQGKNIEVNRTYCRWLGVGADELLGHGWRRFLAAPSNRTDYDAEWAAAFDQGREVEFRIDLRSVDGETGRYDVHAYPITSHAGEVAEYLGVLRPVE